MTLHGAYTPEFQDSSFGEPSRLALSDALASPEDDEGNKMLDDFTRGMFDIWKIMMARQRSKPAIQNLSGIGRPTDPREELGKRRTGRTTPVAGTLAAALRGAS